MFQVSHFFKISWTDASKQLNGKSEIIYTSQNVITDIKRYYRYETLVSEVFQPYRPALVQPAV